MSKRDAVHQSTFWLPPSFVREHLFSDAEAIYESLRELAESQAFFPVLVEPLAGFFLLSVIQYALSAPDMPPTVAATAKRFAEALQSEISSRSPGLAGIMEAGWHRELDSEMP